MYGTEVLQRCMEVWNRIITKKYGTKVLQLITEELHHYQVNNKDSYITE